MKDILVTDGEREKKVREKKNCSLKVIKHHRLMTVILKVKCVISVTSSTQKKLQKEYQQPKIKIADQLSGWKTGDISEFSGQKYH